MSRSVSSCHAGGTDFRPNPCPELGSDRGLVQGITGDGPKLAPAAARRLPRGVGCAFLRLGTPPTQIFGGSQVLPEPNGILADSGANLVKFQHIRPILARIRPTFCEVCLIQG